MANAATWFEVPVTNMARAKKFYTEALGASFKPMPMGGAQYEQFDHFDMESYGAGGALVQGDGYKPSQTGAVVYMGCDDVAAALKKIAKAGGKVVMEKTSIGENGFVGMFVDTEGNKLALHQAPK
jgi:predicted enzyme related to lactoylglutathione lyase